MSRKIDPRFHGEDHALYNGSLFPSIEVGGFMEFQSQGMPRMVEAAVRHPGLLQDEIRCLVGIGADSPGSQSVDGCLLGR